MYKKAQVVMLPTEKGVIVKKNIINELKLSSLNNPLLWIPQHLYIISDDEIKESDWVYFNNGTGNYIHNVCSTNIKAIKNNKTSKKIIATTDISLKVRDMNDLIILPQPSQQFITKYIEEYNKGNIITDVLVEYEEYFNNSINTRQTVNSLGLVVNDTKLKINPKDNTIIIKKLKDNWNREEIIAIHKKNCERLTNSYTSEDLKWINQNL